MSTSLIATAGTLAFGRSGAWVGSYSEATVMSRWATLLDINEPAPGDLVLLTFYGRHPNNSGTWTRDDPTTDRGWLDWDFNGYTVLADLQTLGSAIGSPNSDRFMVLAKRITASSGMGGPGFAITASDGLAPSSSGSGYDATNNGYRVVGWVFRRFGAYAAPVVDSQRAGSSATFTPTGPTMATPGLAIVAFSLGHNATPPVVTDDAGFLWNGSSATGGYPDHYLAHKTVPAGAVTAPALGLSSRQMAVALGIRGPSGWYRGRIIAPR